MTLPQKARAIVARDRLTTWLYDAAFPLWSGVGTDHAQGGFFETIDRTGQPSHAPRRTRVVGRQIFAFAYAGKLGWQGPAAELVAHGIDYLKRCCIAEDGTVVSATQPDGTVVDAQFDLYDHAFALFGLAIAAADREDGPALAEIACRMRERMKSGWGHPEAGFEESMPPSLPLKANPHMHLFEASLAWIDAVPEAEDTGWHALADEIGSLSLSHFIAPETGALREFYDQHWQPIEGDAGRIVEPGHQFEWAWLLQRWGQLRGREDAKRAAHLLVHAAETHGVDPARDLAIMEIWDDLTVKDDTARLWQQTERIKGWLAMAELVTDNDAREQAYAKVADAAAGLERYFDYPVHGGAWERMRADGSFFDEEARASSLYHIVCAVAEMHRLL